jgi:hypothetical protein
MACALAKIIEIIPLEKARAWEMRGVADISNSDVTDLKFVAMVSIVFCVL